MQGSTFISCIFYLTLFVVYIQAKTVGLLTHRRSRRQVEANICSSIQCDHGVCDPTASALGACKCFKNWTGPLCNYKCNKICGRHGHCSLFGNIENCKCEPGYSGEFCEKKVHSRRVLPQLQSQAFSHVDSFIFQQQPENNTVFDDKVCLPGFVCFHGVCVRGRNGHVLTVRCQCDRDWIGTFCHVQCTRQCLNGGRCFKERPNGKDFCICPFNFSGPFCEIRNPDNRAFRVLG